MSAEHAEAAIEGWYSLDRDAPHLIGSRCCDCGSYYFPPQRSFCKNPDCQSNDFEDLPLSRQGKLWSYTNACYTPPQPYVAAEPFLPFSIGAVELEKEKMIVLGQMIEGVSPGQLKVGMPVELALEPLHRQDDVDKLVWKWRPLSPEAAQ